MRRFVVTLAMLLLLAAIGLPLAPAESLKVDILDDANTDPADIEPGFVGWAPKVTSAADPPPTSQTFGNITISFDVGAYQQDRLRTLPANTPASAMYQDCFMGRAADLEDKGLDITISGLVPNYSYLVALYAYDYADWNGTPSCDWTANGQFAFNASWYAEDDGGEAIDLPTSLDTFRHTVLVDSDANGEILLVSSPGAGTPSSTYWAFCSGLEVHSIPEPGTIACLLGVLMGVLFIRRR